MGAARTVETKAPSPFLLLGEGRALFELGAYCAAYPWFGHLPKGDGHAVLLLPGLSASDLSMKPLESMLRGLGYDPHHWRLGRNFGLRPGVLEGMLARLEEIHAASGGAVSLVGWSLGGVYARELAKLRPKLVRQVISLGSPFAGSLKATHAWRLYEFTAGHKVEAPPIKTNLAEPPPVPTTSIYSRTDGVVAWQCCRNDPAHLHTDNIEIEGSHLGLGVNPLVLYALADRLAQTQTGWQRFSRSGLRRLVFRDPERDQT
jgi:pimeloyl-ACP methyl ester carboxylesterase